MSYRTSHFREYFAVITLCFVPGFPKTQPHSKIWLFGPRQTERCLAESGRGFSVLQGRRGGRATCGAPACAVGCYAAFSVATLWAVEVWTSKVLTSGAV